MKIAHDEKIENPTEEQLTLELTVCLNKTFIFLYLFINIQGDQEENVEEFLRDIFFAQEQVFLFFSFEFLIHSSREKSSIKTIGKVHCIERSVQNLIKPASYNLKKFPLKTC